MGSAPKKISRAVKKTGKKVSSFVDKKLVEPTEKLVKKVGTEVSDTVMGTDKTDRRANDTPTVSKAPKVSKVEPEKSPTLTYAQGGLSAAEQRKLMQKNKAFKQTKI
jgi:hypothetical protein